MMRRLFVMSAVLTGLMLGGGGAFAQTPTVVATDHDLRTGNTATTTQVCVYCHTPHKANLASTPLWNRENPLPTAFAMYDSPTLNSKTAAGPQGVSLACLSCHDGATAYNALSNAPTDGTADNAGVMTGNRAVGSDGLANDHPISMKYDPIADTGLRDPMTVLLPLYGVSSDQVECGTCHNPHDSTNGAFLRLSTTNSALCTNCHEK